MPVAIGIQLPIQSQSTIYAQPWEADAGPDELIAVAAACEATGFDYVAVCDHVAIPRDRAEAMSTVWYDTVATLAFLAAATEQVRLLSHVYVPLHRHPLQVAKSFATLDHLSAGRVVLGVGAGHVEGEFEALGADFSRRGVMLDESLDAVRAALSEEFPSHHGAEWSFEDVGQRPRPTQERLPIWVAGSSKAAMRRAARKGDGWLPQLTPLSDLADAYEFIRSEREAAGVVGPFTNGALCGGVYVGDPGWDIPEHTVSGPAERLARFVGKFASAGADQVQVQFPSRSVDELVDQIGRFGGEVIPLLEDL